MCKYNNNNNIRYYINDIFLISYLNDILKKIISEIMTL